jgi:alpha-mannosidase
VNPRVVHLVPHTHWDREWYLPFQSFRLRLVRLIDKVLELMDADERFVFTLDGQLQTIDDYLEIRPENEGRLRALVESGRLAIGPWQVLMDEFLVSGETTWRNLERGLARSREFGGEMRVGYLPDMFGHVAQMPQILRAHGLDNAVVWRGVPATVDSHRFEWRGIDGSSVRAEYLPQGYGNAAYLLAVPDRLGEAVETLVESLEPFFDGDPVLAMYGTDHQEPLPELVEVVERANAENGRVRIDLVTLGQALTVSGTAVPDTVWTGEMRSGARANVLMNVTSARMDIKAAASRAERWLERYAEPFAVLHGDAWPGEFLELAWTRVLENCAHDSVCGCSTDEVSAQVLVRYAEAESLGRDLAHEALAPARRAAPRGAAVVANPSPFPREEVVELELPAPDEWDAVALELPDGRRVPAQELARKQAHLHRTTIVGRDIPDLLARKLHGRELFHHWLNAFTVEDARIVLHVDDEPDPVSLDASQLRREIELAALTRPDDEWELVFEARARRTLAARVPAPPLGWTSVRAVEGGAAPSDDLTVDVEALPRIVRGLDVGDSYNYGPPPDDEIVSEPTGTAGEIVEQGPLRTVVDVTRTYRWSGVDVPVVTRVERRAGEPFVRYRISFDNVHDDHRVRVHVPLAREARSSFAEGQYAVVERGLSAEGGYGEHALPTFPATGFAAAGGIAALLEHVSEYEVVGGELALTVLRSTGWISRHEHPYREDPAGPEIAIPAAQMRGPWSFAFALLPYEGERPGPEVLREAERYRLPFATGLGEAETDALQERPGLELEGDGVVLTALRPHELRVVNQTPEPRTAVADGEAIELRPWEIRTLRRTS